MHGLKYVADQGSSFLERLAWCLLFAGGLCTSAFFCLQLWDTWDADPVLTTVDTVSEPIDNVDFPSVSVCFESFPSQNFPGWLNSERNTFNLTESELGTLVDVGLSGSRTLSKSFDFAKIWQRYNLTDSVFKQIMIEISPSCDSLIRNSHFKEFPFSKSFPYKWHLLHIYQHVCCVFNNYYSLNGLNDSITPWKASRIDGLAGGLRFGVVMNNNYEKFGLIVAASYNYPRVGGSYVSLYINHSMEVAIDALLIDNDENVQTAAADRRKCYFSHEKSLNNSLIYSYDNCIVNCRAKAIYQMCGCLPYTYALFRNVSICKNRAGIKCAMVTHVTSSFDEFRNFTCDCYSSCKEIMYNTQIRTSLADFSGRKDLNDPLRGLEGNVTGVRIFFRTPRAQRIKRSLRYTWQDFISSVGGLLGLGLGFSLLSGAEMFYWLFIRMWRAQYMDSRKDEQERGITMKSSSITLYHSLGGQEYLVNLIDSPGHVDFSSEVSTAVRLCDGAIIVVDVVEGVCAQTKVVLRQAWEEHIRPVLVLNKIDRLITEMGFAPLDAYVHLTQVLEQINAEVGELFATDVLSKADLKEKKDTLGYDWSSGLEEADDSNLYFLPEEGNVVFASAGDGWGFTVSDFAKLYADKLGVPEEELEKCIWGDYFYNSRTKSIVPGAQAKAKKPLFVQLVLENLWAAYEAIVIRKDKIMMEKIVTSLNLKIPPRDMKHTDPKVQIQAVCSHWLPLSQAVLKMVCEKLPSPEELSEIRALRLMCSHGRNFESYPPETQALKEAFVACDSSDSAPVIIFISKMCPVERRALPQNKQRPLTVEEIAQRRELARQRLKEREAQAMGQGAIQLTETQIAELQKTEAVPSRAAEQPPENLDEDVFVAFARVFSGTLKKGQTLYALGPKYSPTTASLLDTGIDPNLTLKDLKAGQHVTKVTVNDLYLLMGRELESLDSVPAGNVLGIGGLEEHVLKSATLSSTLACPSFSELSFMAVPIVRVAVEPKKPSEMPSLLRGLRLLNQADPCVQVLVQENGEHVLITAGEVHLQRCLQDLRERYAKIDINSSPPIVPFRETIVPPPTMDRVNEAIEEQSQKKDVEVDYVELSTPNKRSTVRIRAAPLPSSIVQLLDKHSELLKAVATVTSVKPSEISDAMQQLTLSGESATDESGLKQEEELSPLPLEGGKLTDENALLLLNTKTREEFLELKEELKVAFEQEGGQWQGAENYIWAFGPRRYGPNILLNKIPDWDSKGTVWDARTSNSSKAAKASDLRSEFCNSFVNGFQVATLSGPLCEEPLMGVCFMVEDWVLKPEPESGSDTLPTISTSQPYGPFAGQVISMVKESCRKAFQLRPQRLMAAMYSCVIQVNAEVLGKMYAVLGKRHGQVLAGDMQEGSATFSVTAVLPVVESFDFANEIRKQTSGLASPQLVFSHWEVINEDPFWVPTTEEEIAHFGDKADTENRAQKYMNAVRRRKGLPVHEKVVEFAEKQRTISRKK